MEAKIPLAKIYEHDLGIPDSPYPWQQEYPLPCPALAQPAGLLLHLLQADRELRPAHQGPNRPFPHPRALRSAERTGHLLPYGFIADDGKTAYELKNSLRFTRTPNVIFSLLTASANDPWQTRPTSGLYDSDFRPGYDRQKWKKRAARQPPHRQAPGRLRRLAPRPAPRLRRTGTRLVRPGPYRRHPRSAGSDPGADLPERHRRPHRLHPAPEEVLPRLKALSQSIEQRLAR